MPNIFQTPEWEEFKLKTGYEKSYRVDDVLVLQKHLPFGRTMLYSPMVSRDQLSVISSQKFQNEIKEISSKNRAIFYRLELDIPISDNGIRTTDNSLQNFVKSFEEMQPEHTLVLDLTQSEDEILAQMKPKGRYNIKVAERYGVKVEKPDNRQLATDNFYALYEQMAKRQKITYRRRKYFQTLVDILGKKGYCEVFVATLQDTSNKKQETNTDSHCEESATKQSNLDRLPRPNGLAMTNKSNNIVLASAIVTFYGETATYLFGGSSNEMKNVMAPFKLHWEIIKEAKQRGLKKYDFFGIAPLDQPNHPWAGVTRFKQQFGGQEVKLLGSWDLVFRPTEYQVFKMAEKIRR